LMTSHCESKERIAGLDAGADDFLGKPMEREELLARIRSGLRVRKLQYELAQVQREAALVEIAVTMGHEINNPLTALFGHLELTLQYLERADPDRIQHHLRQAGEVGNRIAEVAHRLISLRNPETKPYLEEVEMLDLGDVDQASCRRNSTA